MACASVDLESDHEADDQLEGAEELGKYGVLSLTFEDHFVEEAFLRKVDDENVWPATVVLSVAFVLELLFTLFLSSFWREELAAETEYRVFALCSNIAGTMGAGGPLIFLRRRWCSCESAAIFAAMMMSVTLFTNNTYFTTQCFGIPGDYLLLYYSGEPILILSLVLINSCVHTSISIRSSRSWILPVLQMLILGNMRFLLTPLLKIDTAFICLMCASAAYLSWRGRRKDEQRARCDYLENCELRLTVDRERKSCKVQELRLLEIEECLRAMESLSGRPLDNIAAVGSVVDAGLPPAPQEEEVLTVPLPSPCRDPAFGRRVASQNKSADVAAPNRLLQLAMTGRRADATRIRRIAEQIASINYSIKEFFEDVIVAFPELELFFVTAQGSSAYAGYSSPADTSAQLAQLAAGEMEYQRTIGALFSVYWLLRLKNDGKHGFCLGITSDWEVRGLPSESVASSHAQSGIPKAAKRHSFLESANWSKMEEMVTSSLGGGETVLEVGRVEAMLCLTAFHDVMKMNWLCPRVAEAHGPYKGYVAGSVIHDHDIALSYVMEYHAELLPSYCVLPPAMQEVVLFTQSKMQFNHGWFVQAEAPPGLMLSPLKGCLSAAQPRDLSFYFFHWLTDLSGAEGTPKGGAEKFVLKFPEPVLAAFLWSMPFLAHLAGRTETQVMEQYLMARWRSAFADSILPTGKSCIALMRLTIMAQGEAGAVVEAFRSLPLYVQEVLSEELARTGCTDQQFVKYPAKGGPALLLYYGPALLQRCRGVEEMTMGLQILAATCVAGRGLWPLDMDAQGNTALIDLSQLRVHDVRNLMGGSTMSHGSIWVMTPKNDREAFLELMPAGEVNQLNMNRVQYWVLDLRLDTDGFGFFSC